MAELPFNSDPRYIASLVTMDDIEKELGTVIRSRGNEFPDATREAIFSEWIREEGLFAQAEAGVVEFYEIDPENEMTEYQKMLLKKVVIYRVCARALRRIELNRTPETRLEASARAKELMYYDDETALYTMRLSGSLKGWRNPIYVLE